MQISEEKLIEDLGRGSHEAFDVIYKMYAKRLYAYCMQYVKTSEDAEDILQGVFCKLWVNRRQIKERQSLKSLLFTIAHHAVIDEYEEFVDRLDTILESPPETQRNVIRRAKFQGMRNADIAAELQLSEQTVKNALSVGMKTLRGKLAARATLLLLALLLIINK